jgi:hypothetical protein
MIRILSMLALCATSLAAAANWPVRAPLAPPDSAVFTLMQRTTQPLPGSTDLLLTIDDITLGQTMTTLEWGDGEHVYGPRSMQFGDRLDFVVAGERWQLTLADLHNELIGNDWAQFELARVDAPTRNAGTAPVALTPNQETDALIRAMQDLDGAVFIRNGSEHTALEAADHLRSKLKAAGGRIHNAEDFIEQIASKSSMTGNPYSIRLRDGKTVDAGEWFRARLAELRG